MARQQRTTSPAKLAAKERAAKALSMRKEGRTLVEIAQACGVTPRRVSQILARAISELNDLAKEGRDELVRLEVERCEAIFASLYPDRSVPRVAEVLMKVMDRKAKYLGLDAPLRIQQDVTVEDLTPAQLADEGRRIGLEVAEFDVVDPAEALPGLDLLALPAGVEMDHPPALEDLPNLLNDRPDSDSVPQRREDEVKRVEE